MNVSRNFVLLGTAFLIVGLMLGMHMGASGDHSLAPSHAHINLIGFVLSMVFALSYRSFAEMGASRLAPVHFWLHLTGAIVLNAMIFLLLSGSIEDAAMFPLAPIAEALVLLGVLTFGWNALRNAR